MTDQVLGTEQEGGDQICPECGKAFDTPQGLGSHRWAAHQVESPHRNDRKRKARTKKPRPDAPCPRGGKEIRADNLKRHLKNVHDIDLDAQAQALTFEVDDIFVTVVNLLFPTGAIPIKALPELLAWREATAKLLETLVSS
jgi:hypothetical protein